MNRWCEPKRMGWSFFALFVSACLKMSEPQVGSETHFLSNCDAKCPAPYSCSCGVCTLACSSDSSCQSEQASAFCREEDDAESACHSAPRVCDVRCVSDLECAALGLDFQCREGQCRTSAESVDACADDPAACSEEHSAELSLSLPQLRVARPATDNAFKQLALGWLHACALRNDGRVYCWGSLSTRAPNMSQPLVRPTPLEVAGVNDCTRIYTGGAKICFSHASGATSCWGEEFTSQEGTGGSYGVHVQETPLAIDELTGITELSLGLAFSCARLAGGDVRCWGLNHRGQLGDGSRTGRAGAASALGDEALVMRGARQIASGDERTCALDQSRNLYCWGAELGSGTPSEKDFLSATRVALPNVIKVDVARSHACALLAGGLVSCWGDNGEGKLGNGTERSSASPVVVRGLRDAVDIAIGGTRSCALRATGQVVCWGSNYDGDLGTGGKGARLTPALVKGLDDAYALDTGDAFSCALSRSRGVVCWGDNNAGQLGDGTKDSRTRPVSVVFPD